ncbi:MAG: phytochelatin synthase family protein, partial [Synechococcaceae cyanobacterium]
MTGRRLWLGLVLLGTLAPARAAPLPLEDPAGLALLTTSTARADYGSLAQVFETQANLAYCGVASSAMVLNSLAVPAPAVPGYGPYRFWTQENFFEDAATRLVKAPELIARQGMTLD